MINRAIAITPGEPAGIGPDILLQYLDQTAIPENLNLIVFADQEVMLQRAQQLNFDMRVLQKKIVFHHVPVITSVTPQKLNPKNANYTLTCLQQATDACLQGECLALVTGPIHKGNINEAGIPFTGHTEFLAMQCHVKQTVMMLMTPQLKVALVTTHLPLSEVPSAITSLHLRRCIEILHHDLKMHFQITQPRILVCGLNPHAGENGHLGMEEKNIIIPTLNQLREQGMQLIGPVAADTAFIPAQLEQCDVVLAMYHDQGLPVLKQHGFGNAINVTLGLPIIRTSVDHGTALDLAGTGKSDWHSFAAAITAAIRMVT